VSAAGKLKAVFGLAQAGPSPVLAATVVERSDVDAEVPANAADTTAAANGKESEEAKK
jgi:hypothetical protein